MKRRELLKWTVYSAGISSIPLSMALIQSCQPTGRVDWTPTSLTVEQAKIVENIGEIILPHDDQMPGAKDVHCAEFVDLLMRDCITAPDKEKWSQGIAALNNDFNETTSKSLDGIPDDHMTKYIESIDLAAFNEMSNIKLESYRNLKQWILLAFFTSETIMANYLDYHAIPGKYVGCIDINAGSKAYVDNNVSG